MNAVHYVEQVLAQALAVRASDIHFEPCLTEPASAPTAHTTGCALRCRLRVDGQLQAGSALPAHIAPTQVLSHIKVLAGLDTAQQRLAQDGRWTYRAAGRSVDLRISTLPTVLGEKLVLRVLDSAATPLQFAALGYDAADIAHLMQALTRPEGMIIATGPTGAGKSASLYACLHVLNHVSRNICSVEDPVEIQMAGINQVQVNAKTGLGFANTLRAFLRQDPDVVMVGEIRDEETAEVALKAAQTGHLVLSTLHTNDAPAALTRLRHMGLPPWLLASSIRLITAQRLLRRVCPHCAVDLALSAVRDKLPAPDWTELVTALERASTPAQLRQPGNGCAQCQQGYRGRIGIFQMLPLHDEALTDAVARAAGHGELCALASERGWRTLRSAALAKAALGLTSLDEVFSHT